MPTDCPYCGDAVPDEAYERHLRRAHADELRPIDERRVGRAADGATGRSLVLYAGVGGVLLLFVLGYAFAFGLADAGTGPGAAVQPDRTAPVHEHGLLSVQYDGRTVDFADPRYQEADECFHFHDDDNEDGVPVHDPPQGTAVWHAHCEGVTVEYALETLGMDVTGDSVTVEGETFSGAEGDEVTVTVDGEPVDPQEHVLRGVEPVDAATEGGGDDVRVVLRSGD